MIREKLEFPDHEEVNFEQTQMNDEFRGELGASALKDELEVLESQHEQENAAADEKFLQSYNNRRWWRTAAPSKDEVGGTYVHERMHPLGLLCDRYWNEAATQYLAAEVDIMHGKEIQETAYKNSVDRLGEILDTAGMTTREFSAYFADEDYNGFMQEIKNRTGLDVDSAYQAIKQRAQEIYPDNETLYNMYIDGMTDQILKAVMQQVNQNNP